MQQISCEKVHSCCPHFVERQASLLWSEEYAICLYSESDESTSRHSVAVSKLVRFRLRLAHWYDAYVWRKWRML